MTISKAAQAAGVGVETVRFYERSGLIAQPARAEGYRQYSAETVDRIRFVKRAQALGFTLPEVHSMLELTLNPKTTPVEIRARTVSKLESIRSKIRELRRMEEALETLTRACDGYGSLIDCPILQALSDPESSTTESHPDSRPKTTRRFQ